MIHVVNVQMGAKEVDEERQQHSCMWPSLKCLIIIGLIGATIQQSYMLLNAFFNGEKWSTVSSIVPVQNLSLPYVIVCNFNRVRASKALALNITEDVLESYVRRSTTNQQLRKQYMASPQKKDLTLMDHFFGTVFATVGINKGLLNMGMMEPRANAMDTLDLGMALYKEFVKDNPKMTIKKLLTALASNCNDTLIFAKYAGSMLLREQFCGGSQMLFSDMGACFTISLPLPQFVLGAEMGLFLLLDSTINDQLPLVVHNFLETGFKLFLTDDLKATVNRPVLVAPATHAYVELAMSKETVDDSESLFSAECTKEQQTEFLNLSYTTEGCAYDCLAKIAWDRCACIPAEFPEHNRTVCEPEQFMCYAKNVINNWSANDTLQKFQTCQAQQCLEPCDKEYLTKSVSVTQFPGRVLGPRICTLFHDVTHNCTNNTINEFFMESVVAVDIYYNRIAYQLFSRSPKTTIIELISNFGGVVGLWIGASFLTFVDIMEWLIEWKRKHTKTRSQVKNVAEKPPIREWM